MPDQRFFAESPESVGVDSGKLEAVFERAEKEVREGVLPSAQIAIARNGKIAGMRTFGRATFQGEAAAPIEAAATNETLYAVFSCTKAFTSAAAWLLIQEGKLDPSEIVADIIPEFATHGKDVISVEQLFTHTAGFPTAPFPPPLFHDREERLRIFSEWRLNFEPGSKFTYHPSSSMYVVAEIIEQRSGSPYGEFIRNRIALPLGLDDLWIGLPDELHCRLANIEHVGDALTAEDYERMGVPAPEVGEVTEENVQKFNQADFRRSGIPGGGGTMTAAELALFYQALVGGGKSIDGEEIWKPETLEMAVKIRSGNFTDPLFHKLANRSLGLIIAGDAERNYRSFGHTNSEKAFGHAGAGGQIAWADPVTGISIGYCTNGHDRNHMRQGRRGVGISSRAAICALD